MAAEISKVTNRALRHFANVLHSTAICIRTPLPQRTPLSKCNLPDELHEIIERYEPKAAKEGLFAHQAAFLKAFLQEGKNDFVMTTATGSGKSLCFWAWVFEWLRRDPTATALLCFPTQALMWGQAKRMQTISRRGTLVKLHGKDTVCGGAITLAGREIRWTIWQGVGADATRDEELNDYLGSKEFTSARIRIATLDKAHWSLFSRRENKAFAARLRCFVLDEAHTYDGVFGANVHYFIRRLYLASHVQSKPRPNIFLASATLAAAQKFAATLASLDEINIVHIQDDVRQQIDMIPVERVPDLLAQPPAGEMMRVVLLLDGSEGTSSVTTFLDDVRLIGKRVNAIYFSPSKFHSKVLARGLTRRHKADGRRVIIYDADLPPAERRKLEDQMNAPTTRGVTLLATSALELGVDIEGLDVCLIDHTPPRRADLLQRIGRVGKPGLVILRLSAEPHDRDMMEHPVESFRLESTRALPIPLHLQMWKWKHMLIAFKEWMGNLRYGDISWVDFGEALERYFGWSPTYSELRDRFLDAYGELVDISDTAWVHRGFRASASEGKIPLKCGHTEIARIEDFAVFRDAHPGAVFLGHDLKHYRVVAYEGRWRIARWEHPKSDTLLGKWLKDIRVVLVERESRAITTRGFWEDRLEFWEAVKLADRTTRPRRGTLKFGIWNYIRSWQGYTEIDLKSGQSRRVSRQEATDEFREALKMRQNAPFLYPFSYRTVGWEWDFGRLEIGTQDEEQLASLSALIGGLLEHFMASAVESKLADITVQLNLVNHELSVLDSTAGGNGLSEALLSEGRLAKALANCCRELEKYRDNDAEFRRYFLALRLEPPAGCAEEIANVVNELHVRWAG